MALITLRGIQTFNIEDQGTFQGLTSTSLSTTGHWVLQRNYARTKQLERMPSKRNSFHLQYEDKDPQNFIMNEDTEKRFSLGQLVYLIYKIR